jgi:L-asparaginase II
LRQFIEDMAGMKSTHTAVDGCGSPAWALSLSALARCYRAGVLAPDDTPLGEVATAMRSHPEFVGGDASEVTGLMRAVPGLLVKDGAESVYAAALSDGRAVAVKISDGGFRAGQVVLVAALQRLGAAAEPGVDDVALGRWGRVDVLGHGRPVGVIRPVAMTPP